MKLATLGPGCAVDDIVVAIDRDGACIVRDVLTPETLARIDEDVTPLIERTEPSGDEWAGRKTKRTGGLIALCPATHPVVMHPLVLGAAERLLRRGAC